MSEDAKKHRASMKEKAQRLAQNGPNQKVDASSWSPQELEGSQKQTGARVLSKRQYKKGGRVAHILGEKSEHRKDRAPRASGGKLTSYLKEATRDKARHSLSGDISEKVNGKNWMSEGHKEIANKRAKGINMALDKLEGKAKVPAKAEGGALTADKLANLNMREANSKREGFKHVGGYKKGGEAHGDEKEDKTLIKRMVKGSALKRASGGKTDNDGDDPFAEDDDAVTRDGKKRGGAAHGPNCMCKSCSSARSEYPDKLVSKGRTAKGGKTPDEGRKARKSGGKATKINIIIAAGGKNPEQPQASAPNAPVRPPVAPPMPPVGGASPMLPPGAGLGIPPAPMARATGGKAYPIEHSASGGLGRLEKLKAYGKALIRKN